MRLIYFLFIGIIASVQVGFAQTEVPLTTNDALIRYELEQEAKLPKEIQFDPSNIGLEKRACQLEQEGITYVNAGDTAAFRIRIDTTGLDTLAGTLTCLNCDSNPLGMATIEEDTLVFIADPAVEAGFLEFEVEFCNTNGCNSATFPILARRSNRNYFPAEELLPAEGIIQMTADAALLPGPLSCNRFVECQDNYQGKEQRRYFTTYSQADNEFIYRASRYAGLDSVCVVLCDTFTICDTFHYAFRIQKDTMKLPFMDDFSYDSPIPSFSHWLDLDAFVNRKMAQSPPSIGVATFDGLNSKGMPYSGDPGISDFLTSNYIDLSSENGDLFLTFWLQRRGLTDKPEKQDSMVVEFKTSSGNWVNQEEYEGSPSGLPLTTAQPFEFYSIEVGPEYRHNGFQFRFKNYSDRTGIFDTWHLDYVRLSSDADSTFRDLAFTQAPDYLLNTYTSIPRRHLEGQEDALISNILPVSLYNHAPEALSANTSSVSIIEKNTQQSILVGDNGLPTLLNDQLPNIPSGVHTIILVDPLANFLTPWNKYIDTLKTSEFGGFETLEFETTYAITLSNQETSSGYEGVSSNDTVRQTTIFDHYFAYDDGSAESGIVTQEGAQVAVQFATSKPDVLRAVRFHFPRTSTDITLQEFELKVWIGELDDTPEFSQIYRPYYVDLAFDSLQGFTTYPLVDDNGDFLPLDLPAGKFYVGWQQASNCIFSDCIPIGYDKNRPQAKDFISRRSGQQWEPLSEFTPGGALMIRPVVGDETPGFTQTEERLAQKATFRLYPNPARDLVQLFLEDGSYDDYQVQIFNGLGQQLRSGQATPQISVNNLTPGVYIVKVINQDTRESFSRRLIVE